MLIRTPRSIAAHKTGVGPSHWGDEIAPPGYHWEYVFDDAGQKIFAAGGTRNPANEPVVALVED